MQQKLTKMKETRLLLLIAMCFTTLLAQKTPSLKCSTGEIRLESKRTNATCGFITGKVEICENGTWKTICDPNWTVNDVKVACRELGYIDQGAEQLFDINLSVPDQNRISSSIPVCSGTEQNLSACVMQTTHSVDTCSTMNIATIRCYQNDSVGSLCSGNSVSTSTGIIDTTDTSYSTPPSASDFTTTNPLDVSTTTTTTNTDSQTQSFLQTPLGLGVMCATIVIIVIVVFITFLIVLLVVYKRSRVNKLESLRVSPQNGNPDDSLKDDSDTKDQHYDRPVFNNTPEQSRHPTSTDDLTPEHHNLYHNHQGPIYEHVKDVPSSSVSSQGSNRSATEPSDSLPTYSTLEQSYSEYAQVQPYINGSLPRGASLQNDNEVYSHYRSLNRTTSQGSNKEQPRTPNMESLPRGHGLMPVGSMQHSSPNQSPHRARTVLSSSASNACDLPVYAILEVPPDSTGGDIDSEVSNSAVVSHSVSPSHVDRVQHYAVLAPANQQQLQTSNALLGSRSRTNTHEHVMPRFKSSTLPNTGRSGPSYPNGAGAHPRWSGCLDARELPNGLETSRLSTHSNPTDHQSQDKYAVNTWV